MNASEIFGLIIRIIGLILALSGINNIYQALIMVVQLEFMSSFTSLLFGIPTLVIGFWLLRGAPWLMSFSYPQHQIKE